MKAFLLSEHKIDAEDFLSEHNAHRVFNLDESGFPLQGNSRLKVIAGRGTKNVYRIAPDDRTQITVMMCGSASGDFCKPFVIFPGGDRAPKFNVPEEYINSFDLGWSKNGWINSDAFFEWLANLFHKSLKDKVQFPILVFMDGHTAHMNVAVSEFCRDHDIILYCLPPHASHIMQPLDVGVFSSLKKNWNKTLQNFEIKYKGLIMNKSHFFTAFGECWVKAADVNKKNIKSGFRKSGLVPYNPQNIDFTKIIDEESSLKKYEAACSNSSQNQYEQVIYKRMSNIFTSVLGNELSDDFKNRYSNNFNIYSNTFKEKLYQVYKSTRDMFEPKSAIVQETTNDVPIMVLDGNAEVIIPSYDIVNESDPDCISTDKSIPQDGMSSSLPESPAPEVLQPVLSRQQLDMNSSSQLITLQPSTSLSTSLTLGPQPSTSFSIAELPCPQDATRLPSCPQNDVSLTSSTLAGSQEKLTSTLVCHQDFSTSKVSVVPISQAVVQSPSIISLHKVTSQSPALTQKSTSTHQAVMPSTPSNSNDLVNVPTKPKYYSPAHPSLSPFKNHLKIDDSVIIARRDTTIRKQNNSPSIRAISGRGWHTDQVAKQVEKESIIKLKEERKKLREEKKKQKAQMT